MLDNKSGSGGRGTNIAPLDSCSLLAFDVNHGQSQKRNISSFQYSVYDCTALMSTKNITSTERFNIVPVVYS